MPLHPQAQAFLDKITAAGVPPVEALTLEELRMAIAWRRSYAGLPEATAKVEDRTILTPTGELPLRIYTPEGQAPFPVLVFFHGGGWTTGDLDTMDTPLRALTNRAGCVVVSVDYRLAPEHKFPAAVEDAYTATRWVAENASVVQGDPTRIAVGGDSSGGNLAAAVALMARDRGEPSLIYQLLVCPVTNHDFSTLSYQENADGYLLTKGSMVWFWNQYLKDEKDGHNPYASPLQAQDFSGLPPALVITAEYDPLRDEGEAYAARLQKAGVSVVTKRYEGMIHGFFEMAALLDTSRLAIEEAAQALRKAFTK
jgi:acetyl esterase